jgi:hypothetical protein
VSTVPLPSEIGDKREGEREREEKVSGESYAEEEEENIYGTYRLILTNCIFVTALPSCLFTLSEI